MIDTSDLQSLYIFDGLSDKEIRREADRYVPLTESVRELVRAALLTEAEDTDIYRARTLIDEVSRMLDCTAIPRSYGVRWGASGMEAGLGKRRQWPAQRNRAAFRTAGRRRRRAWYEFDLRPQYEGPAGLVHGGIAAMVLEQLLGETALAAGLPA